MYGRKGQSIQLGGYCTAVLVETVYRCTGTGVGVSVYRCIGVGVSVYLIWQLCTRVLIKNARLASDVLR